MATRSPLGRVVMRVSGAERIRVWSRISGLGEPNLRKRGSGFSKRWSFCLTDSAKRS